MNVTNVAIIKIKIAEASLICIHSNVWSSNAPLRTLEQDQSD